MLCDRAGARTQDPLLKREMLYQLSYQVKIISNKLLIIVCNKKCDRAGARTQDPLLKREMLYQLSYQVVHICYVLNAGAKIRPKFNLTIEKTVFFYFFLKLKK